MVEIRPAVDGGVSHVRKAVGRVLTRGGISARRGIVFIGTDRERGRPGMEPWIQALFDQRGGSRSSTAHCIDGIQRSLDVQIRRPSRGGKLHSSRTARSNCDGKIDRPRIRPGAAGRFAPRGSGRLQGPAHLYSRLAASSHRGIRCLRIQRRRFTIRRRAGRRELLLHSISRRDERYAHGHAAAARGYPVHCPR
jgi:hypothetical protein